jgi:hypothetical protein
VFPNSADAPPAIVAINATVSHCHPVRMYDWRLR